MSRRTPKDCASLPRPATIARRKGPSTRPAPITWQTASWAATPTGWHFTLPELTSANRLWRRGKGRTYKAEGARADTRAAALLFARCVPLTGPVAVRVRWVRSRAVGDVDNRLKATLDLLRGIAYGDDAQVVRVSIERSDAVTEAAGLFVWVDTVPENIRAA